MIEYKIPDQAREDIVDILAAIEIDIEKTTGMPQSTCKLMVCQLLMTLVANMSKQADKMAKGEERATPKVIN
jgi:hypothetical protein